MASPDESSYRKMRDRPLAPAKERPPAYMNGLCGFLLTALLNEGTRFAVSEEGAIGPRWVEPLVDDWLCPPIHRKMQRRQLANLKRNAEARQDVAAGHHLAAAS